MNWTAFHKAHFTNLHGGSQFIDNTPTFVQLVNERDECWNRSGKLRQSIAMFDQWLEAHGDEIEEIIEKERSKRTPTELKLMAENKTRREINQKNWAQLRELDPKCDEHFERFQKKAQEHFRQLPQSQEAMIQVFDTLKSVRFAFADIIANAPSDRVDLVRSAMFRLDGPHYQPPAPLLKLYDIIQTTYGFVNNTSNPTVKDTSKSTTDEVARCKQQALTTCEAAGCTTRWSSSTRTTECLPIEQVRRVLDGDSFQARGGVRFRYNSYLFLQTHRMHLRSAHTKDYVFGYVGFGTQLDVPTLTQILTKGEPVREFLDRVIKTGHEQGKKICLFGHSMGSQVVLMYLLQNKRTIVCPEISVILTGLPIPKGLAEHETNILRSNSTWAHTNFLCVLSCTNEQIDQMAQETWTNEFINKFPVRTLNTDTRQWGPLTYAKVDGLQRSQRLHDFSLYRMRP